MWTKIFDFFRRHVLVTAVSAATAGCGIGGTVVASLYEASVNRIEQRKHAEFADLVTENNKFLENLSLFTEDLDAKGKADPKKRSDLSATLTRLYTHIGTFSVNVPVEEQEPIRKLQTSVNEVKKKVQITTRKQDLDPLGMVLVDYFRNMKEAKPIIESVVGKTAATIELPSSS